jgi:hypothetical protein
MAGYGNLLIWWSQRKIPRLFEFEYTSSRARFSRTASLSPRPQPSWALTPLQEVFKMQSGRTPQCVTYYLSVSFALILVQHQKPRSSGDPGAHTLICTSTMCSHSLRLLPSNCFVKSVATHLFYRQALLIVNRLKSGKNPSFAHRNSASKTSRSSTNTAVGNGRSSRNAFGGTGEACTSTTYL